MPLKILLIPQKKTCAKVSFLIKLHVSAYNFIKKETMTLVFSVGSAKFQRTPFL